MRKITEKIKVLKEVFETNRQNRTKKWGTSNLISNLHSDNVNQSLNFLYGSNYITKMMTESFRGLIERNSRVENEFRQETSLLINDLEKYRNFSS